MLSWLLATLLWLPCPERRCTWTAHDPLATLRGLLLCVWALVSPAPWKLYGGFALADRHRSLSPLYPGRDSAAAGPVAVKLCLTPPASRVGRAAVNRGDGCWMYGSPVHVTDCIPSSFHPSPSQLQYSAFVEGVLQHIPTINLLCNHAKFWLSPSNRHPATRRHRPLDRGLPDDLRSCNLICSVRTLQVSVTTPLDWGGIMLRHRWDHTDSRTSFSAKTDFSFVRPVYVDA